jgi:transcription initiation factor TFIIB
MGKPLSTSTKLTLNRLRTWDSRSKISDNKDRNLRQAMNTLQIMSEKLSLSEPVVDKAAYIYRKVIENNLLRGRTITSLIAASLYAACRDSETPRTLRDIMKAGNMKYKNLTKSYRFIVRELDLKMPVANSDQCISRIASRAGLSEKIKRYARDIIKKAEQKKIASGKHPMGLAAAALYFACVKNDNNTSQKEIAGAADVSEVTIRNRLKGLHPVISA